MIGESLDRTLAAWFEEDADRRVPDHLDAVLAATLVTRQRHVRPGAGVASWGGRTRVLAIAAAAVLTAAGMAALGIGRQRPPSPPSPAVLADNGVVLVNIKGDIYAFDAAGSNLRAVVTGQRGEFGAVFGPDGSRFAFSEMDASFHVRVLVADADGSNATVVFGSTTVGPTGYAWSPDGKRLAILHGKGDGPAVVGAAVWIVDVDNSEAAREVPLPDDGDLYYGHRTFGFQVAWAGPAGGELILTGGRNAPESGQRFFAIRPDGSGFREIGQLSDHAYVGLSPDRRSLTYFSYLRDGSGHAVGAQTHLVDVATGEDRILLSGHGGWDQELVFSPDGTTGAMVACIEGWVDCDLVIVSLDGSKPARIIGSAGVPTPKERAFVYSPDGRELVVSRNNEPTIVIDVATGEKTVLGDGQMRIEAWQPLPRP